MTTQLDSGIEESAPGIWTGDQTVRYEDAVFRFGVNPGVGGQTHAGKITAARQRLSLADTGPFPRLRAGPQARDRCFFEGPYGANLWSLVEKIEELGLDTDAAKSFGLCVPVGGKRRASDLTPTSTTVGVCCAEDKRGAVTTSTVIIHIVGRVSHQTRCIRRR